PDNNRDVMIAYVRAAKHLTRVANASTRSWRFVPVKTSDPVVFSSAPGVLGLADQAGLHQVSQLAPDDGRGKGMALYAIDLSQ
ncbi:bifunctional metallophosphatase/5'-nucleotidase, partial [Halobellus sp. Atlit-31R]